MGWFVAELADINSDRSSFVLAREGILCIVVHDDNVDEDRRHIHQLRTIQDYPNQLEF